MPEEKMMRNMTHTHRGSVREGQRRGGGDGGENSKEKAAAFLTQVTSRERKKRTRAR